MRFTLKHQFITARLGYQHEDNLSLLFKIRCCCQSICSSVPALITTGSCSFEDHCKIVKCGAYMIEKNMLQFEEHFCASPRDTSIMPHSRLFYMINLVIQYRNMSYAIGLNIEQVSKISTTKGKYNRHCGSLVLTAKFHQFHQNCRKHAVKWSFYIDVRRNWPTRSMHADQIEDWRFHVEESGLGSIFLHHISHS